MPVDSNKDYARICKLFGVQPKDVLIISDSTKPLYTFWEYVHTSRIQSACLVVFLRVKADENWDDLSDYPGVQIGRSYIMKYDPITRVRVCPSQRGLFLRR